MFKINNTYNVFISHSWSYSTDYNTVSEWLITSNITLHDYSVSIECPLGLMSKYQLKQKITDHINPASVVIILAGMYANYSEWIDYEIDEAIRMNKKILGIKPRGQERIPIKISQNANELVSWNSNSVVDAFKRLL